MIMEVYLWVSLILFLAGFNQELSGGSLFLEPHSGIQIPYAQNPRFLANLSQNSVLTIRPVANI